MVERRCGWLSNPSPGNWDFVDRDGTWELTTQGEEGAIAGLPEDRPQGRRWWVETRSGGYGYGCMCLDLQVDRPARRILGITSGKALPLSRCRTDKKLRKREPARTP
jgi:hypothetical protein